jgi:hypothetical protein
MPGEHLDGAHAVARSAKGAFKRDFGLRTTPELQFVMHRRELMVDYENENSLQNANKQS